MVVLKASSAPFSPGPEVELRRQLAGRRDGLPEAGPLAGVGVDADRPRLHRSSAAHFHPAKLQRNPSAKEPVRDFAHKWRGLVRGARRAAQSSACFEGSSQRPSGYM